MIVVCPNCQARLRYKKTQSVEAQKRLCCSRCQTKFTIRQSDDDFIAFVAHEDPIVRDQLAERLAKIGARVETCSSPEGVVEHFKTEQCRILLIDVAFQGVFPFQVIEEIRAVSYSQHKIILLPSVYNRTAYKKRPDSLYGADAYLELHHIGDRLLPLLSELLPEFTTKVSGVSSVSTLGGERKVSDEDLYCQAENLARLLVADILLYHQEELERGLEEGDVEMTFADQLAEGRKLLAKRLPAIEDYPIDFILQAFKRACQSYSSRS